MEIYLNLVSRTRGLPETNRQHKFRKLRFYDHLREPQTLYAYVKERLAMGRMTYVFFDEIQHVKQFPNVVNSLYINPNADVYITGSNTYMLSSEIATLLSGQYVEIPMLPLSLREYLEGRGDMDDLPWMYADYIASSSFPYALDLDSPPKRRTT